MTSQYLLLSVHEMDLSHIEVTKQLKNWELSLEHGLKHKGELEKS